MISRTEIKDPRLGVVTENIDGRYLMWHGRTPMNGMNKEGNELGVASHSFGIYDPVNAVIQIEHAAEIMGVFMPGAEKPVVGKLKDGANACSIFDLLGKFQKEGMQLMHAGFFDYEEPKEEKKNA